MAAVAQAHGAHALPVVLEAQDVMDDATLTLRVLDQAMAGDVRSWCEVRVQVNAESVSLTTGDRVQIDVYENDGVGDDLLWHWESAVTADEAVAGLVGLTLDCSAAIPENDPGGVLRGICRSPGRKGRLRHWVFV